MFSDFQHILIPLDFTERNDAVLEAAYDLAAETNTRLTLIHVVEPIGDGSDKELATFTQKLSKDAEEQLRARAARFDDLDISIACENRVGKRNAEIVAFATDEKVDLILMNTHLITAETAPRSAFSLSHQVALLAPCAILMMKS